MFEMNRRGFLSSLIAAGGVGSFKPVRTLLRPVDGFTKRYPPYSPMCWADELTRRLKHWVPLLTDEFLASLSTERAPHWHPLTVLWDTSQDWGRSVVFAWYYGCADSEYGQAIRVKQSDLREDRRLIDSLDDCLAESLELHVREIHQP